MQHLKIGVLDNDGSALHAMRCAIWKPHRRWQYRSFMPTSAKRPPPCAAAKCMGGGDSPKFCRRHQTSRAAPLVLQLNGQFGLFAGIITRDAGRHGHAFGRRGNESAQQTRRLAHPSRTYVQPHPHRHFRTV